MVTLAILRDAGTPTRAGLGLSTPVEADGAAPPTLAELLAKTVPVGLISAYTAFVAVVSEFVAQPTPEKPTPELYLPLRWSAFVLLVLLAAALTVIKYRSRSNGSTRWPVLETAAVTIAAVGWGLAIPSSPLLAGIHDAAQGAITVAFIAFAGVGINLVISSLLKKAA